MMAATHRLGGLAAGTAAAVLLHAGKAESGLLIAGAVLGSLIPDIDNRHSSISRKWVLLSTLVSIGQMIIRAFSSILPRKQRNYIRSLIGHRGITHSLVPVIVIPLIICLIGHMTGCAGAGTYTAAGIGLGILSHLLFDMLAGGVPLFMPFSTKRIYLAHIKTGGAVEWIFRVILILVFTYFGMEVISWQRLLL